MLKTLAIASAIFATGAGAMKLYDPMRVQRWFSSPRNFAVVEKGAIYRSGQLQDQWVLPTFRDHGIKHIVNLGEDKPKPDQIAERDAARELNIDRNTYFLEGDGTGPFESYVKAVKDIANARKLNQPILVHCSAGAQRTSGAIAIYQLLVLKEPTEKVKQHMLDFHCREDNPNLMDYLNQNLPAIAKRLVEDRVIDRVPDPMPVFSK
jgi:protein tyrosine/serine phosphatase